MSEREQPIAAGLTVLSAGARELYLAVVRGDSHLPLGSNLGQNDSARDELVRIGLLVPDTDDPDVFIAADPTQLSASLSNSWQRQALDLLSRAVSLPSELQELAQEFHSPKQLGGSIEYVRGKALIHQRVQQDRASGLEEALALQPGGPRPADVLSVMIEQDLDTLRSGTKMRTIYHASTRYHQPTRDYVATLARAGGQYRTLDEPYTRLIVMDRRVAVIPIADDMSLAAFIYDPAVVNYLVEEVFERCWSRALEFEGDRTVPQQVVSRLRRTIIEQMLEGTNHRVIARRLGISERTLARHIAEMRDDYKVDSLFQLGYVLGRQAQEHAD
ncbi:helix-turn-helix domain-containing protein [Streptomyces sp. FH025]|uniref:helix-turn-helix domain-containing protein n=1 Tax=Streptomyces sp. FH025 TaxID=2815937 RepID=UPI001A9E3116|nr:helix-turn-helix domain-containing protein [Streptomyces sp. FH025]MBO1414397.1 helix-turn-helix domain-containing protein [Streptomyces sp. FH025]